MTRAAASAVGRTAEEPPRRLSWALLAAAVGDTFERSGVRYLLIKGVVPEARGLREHKRSADLDVLVHPDDSGAAISSLLAWGWVSGAAARDSGVRAPHAETLVHDGWPLAIDLHHSFPGFTDGPERAFDALWARREPLSVAGRSASAPDRVGAAAIEALNAMRSAADASFGDTHQLAGATAIEALDESERRALAEFAQAAGAAYALEPILTGVPGLDPSTAEEFAWDLQRRGAGPFVARAAADVLAGGTRDRLGAVARMMWPRRDEFVRAYALDGAPASQVLRARLARFIRGLRKVPGTIRTGLRIRHGRS